MSAERKRPLVVGVTGGLGAGKSTLCRLLAARGIHVIDADQVARAVTAPGSPALSEIEAAFGPGLIDAAGRLDRAALAARALAAPEGQAKLNAILHPRIRAELASEVERLQEAGTEAVVIEATLILESGHRDFYDLLVVVVAANEEKVRRAVARGMDADEARRRLDLQWGDEVKSRAADHIVINDGSLEALAAAADGLARKIRSEAARL